MIFKLPDTGQTRCYDSKGNIIVRPKEGEEFYGQNGCYIINPMSFTKMDAHRNILNDTATWEDEFRIVLDNNTGLMWEEKSKILGDINYFENKYTFEEAKKVYIEKLNNIRYGGYEDWRLPSREVTNSYK